MRIIPFVLVGLPLVIAAYAYIGYPLILWIVSVIRRRDAAINPSGCPPVSIVIPAYNEERQIAGAIEALLAQDYPHEQLQILVLSDASTDRTDQIVGEYESRGVELLRMPHRSGKTKMENLSSPRLRGEIIVNSDSSIRLHPAAVRELVTRMSDPNVGVASGRDVSISDRAGANVAEAGYVGYEMHIRKLETLTGGIVGASGSCYAIRAELHRIPIRDDLSRDFCAALTAREHGFRSISVDDAICFVPRTSSLQHEYRRKVRTISRGMDTL
jgi:cellulose synthase/poly-beta-1,6-N-acetylglucosamine synthase-like glycosyltransferase